MIRVKYDRDLYMFLYEVWNDKLDDIRGGYITLDCDEDFYYNTILRTKPYWDRKQKEKGF